MKKIALAIFLLTIFAGILSAFLGNSFVTPRKKSLIETKQTYKIFVSDLDWHYSWHLDNMGRIDGTAKIAIFTKDGRFYFGDNCDISLTEFQDEKKFDKKYSLQGCLIFQGNWRNDNTNSYISEAKYSKSASYKTIRSTQVVIPEDSEIPSFKLVWKDFSNIHGYAINDEWIPNLLETEFTDSHSKETRKLKFVSSIYEVEFIENILQN